LLKQVWYFPIPPRRKAQEITIPSQIYKYHCIKSNSFLNEKITSAIQSSKKTTYPPTVQEKLMSQGEPSLFNEEVPLLKDASTKTVTKKSK